tara:strand:- start:305 stop:640 length:336 start_codon:yes stop_codon:yes gene_type:complete
MVQMTDDFEKEIELEKNFLLPDRYYVILKPNEGGFSAKIFDTTGGLVDEDGHPHPAEVAVEGILALLQADIDKVFSSGVIAIQAREDYNETVEDEYQKEDNIIRVDFGAKQ